MHVSKALLSACLGCVVVMVITFSLSMNRCPVGATVRLGKKIRWCKVGSVGIVFQVRECVSHPLSVFVLFIEVGGHPLHGSSSALTRHPRKCLCYCQNCDFFVVISQYAFWCKVNVVTSETKLWKKCTLINLWHFHLCWSFAHNI